MGRKESPPGMQVEESLETEVIAVEKEQIDQEAVAVAVVEEPQESKVALEEERVFLKSPYLEVIEAYERKLQDDEVDYLAERMDYMVDNPVHPGRAKLQRQMQDESYEETFAQLGGNDNMAMLMGMMHGRPFSPGNYESDGAGEEAAG